MAYIRFLGEKTPHKATVIPTNNIVTVKFGTDVIENKNGFDLFLDKECTIDIGGTFYQKFTTIYRNYKKVQRISIIKRRKCICRA